MMVVLTVGKMVKISERMIDNICDLNTTRWEDGRTSCTEHAHATRTKKSIFGKCSLRQQTLEDVIREHPEPSFGIFQLKPIRRQNPTKMKQVVGNPSRANLHRVQHWQRAHQGLADTVVATSIVTHGVPASRSCCNRASRTDSWLRRILLLWIRFHDHEKLHCHHHCPLLFARCVLCSVSQLARCIHPLQQQGVGVRGSDSLGPCAEVHTLQMMQHTRGCNVKSDRTD